MGGWIREKIVSDEYLSKLRILTIFQLTVDTNVDWKYAHWIGGGDTPADYMMFIRNIYSSLTKFPSIFPFFSKFYPILFERRRS